LVNTGYLLAKAKYLSNDLANAEILLKLCLDKEETIAEAYLLMAQIHIYKNHYEEAGRYLDTGLSFNFKVREHPLYHLIKAKLQKKSNQIEQSVITLRKAVELPAFQDTVINKRDKLDDEADVIMEEATSRWSGKAEEQQLMLMDADLKLMRNDIDGALKVLSSVSPTQSNYQIARIKMAQIYLEEKKDKRQFAICYKQIIERNPSPAAYILLGNAYMSIQEPAKAIEVYETALKNNPKNDELAEKIGQAYVQCHLYNRAVNYYEAALKSGHKSRIRQRLAELLVQLGNYERCEKVLRQGLESNSNSYEVATMSNHVSYWMLLSKLHFEKGDWLEAAEDLTRAKDLQKLLISKSPSELSNLAEEKKFAAKICCQLAELHWNRRDGNKAIEFYKEAIALNNTDIKTMTSLATIYLSMNKFDACNTQCQLVLNIDKQNDDATLVRHHISLLNF
uniref:Probable UDP-N-acetylglucosamine--peptide N-acetylglucosaminyltransferase SPINDLY n=1 Tax=Dracunculus medinensis TaxID=318479 RepID=A0A0N4UKG1_DRAME